MNIVVKPYGSDLCYCRPDTTWERENRDIYSPECIDEWNAAPILFARISKAGKCISQKFIYRYYDGFNFGMLLYIGGKEVAFASCADHTSILPFPLYNPVVLENEENPFSILRNGQEIFVEEKINDLKTILEDSICKASKLTSLRIGDFVAVELDLAKTVSTRQENETALKATFCENSIFDFRIIF